MSLWPFEMIENKIIVRLHDRTCETAEELLASDLFREVLRRAVGRLAKRESILLDVFPRRAVGEAELDLLVQVLTYLTKMPGALIPNVVPGSEPFFRSTPLLHELIEYLYNYWRQFDRFIISHSEGRDLDKRPYRTFNSTIGQLTNLIRGLYRDIQENITGNHPRIYRQVAAGAEVSTIAVKKTIPFPGKVYDQLNRVPVIRQILLCPPLILNSPMNKRTGKFNRVNSNPLEHCDLNEREWLCYPAKVGPLVILVYFHSRFYGLGHALCNLFQLAEDEDLERQPDAVYVYGVPGEGLDQYGVFPTVFYDNEPSGMLVGAVPGRDEFAYFGYLKKMMLTLHNIIMMKQGRLPFHGALVRLILRGNRDRTILFIGDTGAGKSETLEALRELGDEHIQDLIIIADDMGSLETRDGAIIGYGTEIGAFLRLDDLQPGYALGQIDRAIILNANQVNARIVLPVTSFENLIRGQKIDYILYANNYDEIDEEHPVIQRFDDVAQALMTFREGTVMSKGTTTTTGLVHSYFANVFGPPQYKDLHDPLAKTFFEAMFTSGVYVGQVRTRLGLSGWERKGPEEAARELLTLLKS